MSSLVAIPNACKQAEAISTAYQLHIEQTLKEEAGACLLRPCNDGFQVSTVSQATVFFADMSEADVSVSERIDLAYRQLEARRL